MKVPVSSAVYGGVAALPMVEAVLPQPRHGVQPVFSAVLDGRPVVQYGMGGKSGISPTRATR